MSHPRNQAGNALTLVLAAVALLAPLGALAVLQSRTSLLVQQNIRGEAEALARAEAGLEWATAALRPELPAARLLSGPDAVAGTADDGVFPLPLDAGIPSSLPGDVRVTQAQANLFSLTATGNGTRGAARIVERLVRRAAEPYRPAAIYAGDATVPDLGASGFVVSGFDHLSTDAIGSPTGAAASLPALAFASEAAEASARAGLDAGGASRLLGAGGSPSLAHVRPLDLGAVADSLTSAAGAVRYYGGLATGDVSLGTSGVLQITVSDGDAVASGAWTGHGVFVVRGRLHVAGSLDFTGLIVATGGVVVEAGGSMSVRGGLWLGGPPLQAAGGGGVAACAACVTAADAAFPDVLPHGYQPGPWREIS